MTWAAIAWVAEGMILACLSVAVATDLARRIIPNRLVLLVLCCSIVLRAISNTGPFWVIPLVLVTVSTALSLLASYDLIGWGDVKLIAAVSVAVPVSHLVTLTMAITLAGGLLSCLYLACRFALQRIAAPAGLARSGPGQIHGLLQLAAKERARIVAGEPKPYAVAIFGGAAYTLLTG